MDRGPDSLPEDVVPLILNALADDQIARDAFTDGLSKRIYFLSIEPGPEMQQRLLRFVGEWACDVVLAQDEAWREQVADSERAIAEGKAGGPISGADLRDLLSR